VEAASSLVRAMVEGIVFTWISDTSSYDLKQRADELTEVIISTLKGGALTHK